MTALAWIRLVVAVVVMVLMIQASIILNNIQIFPLCTSIHLLTVQQMQSIRTTIIIITTLKILSTNTNTIRLSILRNIMIVAIAITVVAVASSNSSSIILQLNIRYITIQTPHIIPHNQTHKGIIRISITIATAAAITATGAAACTGHWTAHLTPYERSALLAVQKVVYDATGGCAVGVGAAFVGAVLYVLPQCFHFYADRYATGSIGTSTRMTKQQQTLLLLLHRLDGQFGQGMRMIADTIIAIVTAAATVVIPRGGIGQDGIDLGLRQAVQMLWLDGYGRR
mmetsp:Transcript_3898/g.5955  ORF Transcript_3898/g.5955 Transcript_3898/m.5955 type:complete len:283 (-) Transcript_3898:1489-2337(-)